MNFEVAFVLVVLIICVFITLWAYMDYCSKKGIKMFKNPKYDKRMKKLEKQMEDLKKTRRIMNKKNLTVFILIVIIIVFAFPHKASSRENYIGYCEQIGEMYGICPELLQSIIENESNYDPKETSHCNAQGLCQIIPKYQKERMERLGVTDLYDPYGNILVCADILAEFRDKYDDLYCVLMCYNEGEYGGAIDRFEYGNYSKYAMRVVERAEELERINGK